MSVVTVRGQAGPQVLADGAEQSIRIGKSAEVVVTELHGRYFEQVYRGNAFFLGGTGLAPTAYGGAAGGTPLIAVHNPTGSGRILVALAVMFGQGTAATAAGSLALNVFTGVSAQPTGTQTVPRNALSQQASGSAALGFLNAVLTGSTALNAAGTIATLAVGAAATALGLPGMFELAGLVVAAPGNQIAVGVSAVPTTLTANIGMYWEEVPI